MPTRCERFAVSVPASSANLGSGFDAVAVALSLHMRADVEPAPRFALCFEERGEPPAHDGLGALMLRAIHELGSGLPAVRVRVTNEIPLGKGLGSSAAAIVLALAVASRASGKRLPARELGRIASTLEGHPDNAFAAALGGAVVAADCNNVLRLPCPVRIRPLVVVPDTDLDTCSARMLLPPSYPREDVAFTAARAALLGAALASGDLRYMREAMRDRAHQPYRAARIPGLLAALDMSDPALAGIALSGAGPSVIALIDAAADHDRVGAKLCALFERAGVHAQALALQFSMRGVNVRALPMEAEDAA